MERSVLFSVAFAKISMLALVLSTILNDLLLLVIDLSPKATQIIGAACPTSSQRVARLNETHRSTQNYAHPRIRVTEAFWDKLKHGKQGLSHDFFSIRVRV